MIWELKAFESFMVKYDNAELIRKI